MRPQSWPAAARLALITLITLIAAAGHAGCGEAAVDTTIDRVVDPCRPVVLVPEADTTDAERRSIGAAMAMWQAVAPLDLRLADPASASDGAGVQRVPVRFQRVAAMYNGLYQDETGRIFVNRTLADARHRAITVAHELGHAFGLAHTGRAGTVMREANLSVVPSGRDVEALASKWGDCVRGNADE